MKLSHKCDRYSIKELRRVGKLVIKASREVIGHGNKPIPKLHIRNTMKNMYGKYCYTHKIYINPSECETISVYVGVIIHEYTHHIQKGLRQNYDASVKQHGYQNCPFEVEANENAKKYKKKVWKKVKQELS